MHDKQERGEHQQVRQSAFTSNPSPRYKSVRARYIGLREKPNGPVTTSVVAGSDGFTFVPALSKVRRLQTARIAPNDKQTDACPGCDV